MKKLLHHVVIHCAVFCQPVNTNQVFSIFKHVHELRHEQANQSFMFQMMYRLKSYNIELSIKIKTPKSYNKEVSVIQKLVLRSQSALKK